MTAVAPVRAAGRERAEEWRDELGTAFNRLVPEPLDGRLPDGHLDGGGLGTLCAFTVTGSPQVVRRTAAATRRQPAELLKICLQVRGRATVHQDGAEVVVEPGHMAMYDTSRPYDLRLEGSWTCAVLAFPGAALALPRQTVDAARMRALPVGSGSGAVLAGFVATAVLQRGSIAPGSAERLGEAGLHLVAGALSGALPADGAAAADAARLQVLAYVRAHLDDPDLSHATVAAAHHMAPRTLTRLFEAEPFTVSQYIRSGRLHAVRRDLGDALTAGRTIAAVAARWCFTDQAHFTRAFRAEFGVTPSELRGSSGG
jgi:AraC-like DNA-binding protein/plasmid stabilization system protein ParE